MYRIFSNYHTIEPVLVTMSCVHILTFCTGSYHIFVTYPTTCVSSFTCLVCTEIREKSFFTPPWLGAQTGCIV